MDKKELQSRQKHLSWYLKFIQADLDSLDDRDIALPLHLLYLLPAGPGDWPEIANQHKDWFGDLKARQDRPTPTHIKFGDRTLETKEFLKAPAVQKRLREFLSQILNEKLDTFELMPKAKIVLLKERTTHVDLTSDEAIDTRSMPRSFQIRSFPIGKDDPGLSTAIFNFASLLNGLPVDSIRKCEECQNYFVNLSKRKQIFCSIKCAWKNHARLTREELKKHPRKYKTYLKKQKQIMKKKRDEAKEEKEKRKKEAWEERRKAKKNSAR